MDTDKEVVTAILEESIGSAKEVEARFMENAQAVSDWVKDLYKRFYDKTYDAHTYFGYVYHILSMSGGEFTIPASVRIEKRSANKRAQILQTENPDGSCTIRINHLEEDENSN